MRDASHLVVGEHGGTMSLREEIWLRARSELAHREFASRSSALLATFHTGQPVAFAQLSVSQWGIAVPRGKNYPARVLPLQDISQVRYDQYRNRKGNRRALLSFTLHSTAKIPSVDVVSAVDAALLLLFLHTLSRGRSAVCSLAESFDIPWLQPVRG